jgi:hypothetical protein
MRNDVSIPPEEIDSFDERIVVEEPQAKIVSTTPIPPPEGLKADVELFDHPDFAASGAGNFWLLGMIGLALLGIVVMILWTLHGWMK